MQGNISRQNFLLNLHRVVHLTSDDLEITVPLHKLAGFTE